MQPKAKSSLTFQGKTPYGVPLIKCKSDPEALFVKAHLLLEATLSFFIPIMIAIQVVVFFVSLLHVTLAAPVTVWQTTTAVTNADGSLYTYNPNADAGADATLAVAATTATSAASAAATGGSSSGSSIGSTILSSILNWLSSKINSGSRSSSSTASSSSSGSGFSFSSWLRNLFDSFDGGSGSDSGTSTQQPTSTATSTFDFWGPKSSSTSASSTSSSSTSSSSDSGSTGGLYDAIYNSKEDIDVDFAKDILDAHNKYRAQHGVGDLAWADGPYEYAKANADAYDCSGVLTHTHGQYGENLAAGFSNGPSAVKAWYDEGETFNYNTYNEYNHFTQVVWKGSRKVGCAYKDCRSNNWGLYIVCEYDPVGNVIGQEQANVLRPI